MIPEIKSLIDVSKSIVGLLKDFRDLAPAPKQSEIAEKIEQAEKELSLAESATAKELGYDLCQCTFPPQIMLYKAEQGATVCPVCSNAKQKKTRIMFGGDPYSV